MTTVAGAPPSEPEAAISDALRGELWREVSRHLDLGRSAAELLKLVGCELSVSRLTVRRWEPDAGALVVLVVAAVGAGGPQVERRLALPTPKRAELLAWARAERPIGWRSRDDTGLARLLVPEGLAGEVAAAPLSAEGELKGVLVLQGPDALAAARVLHEPMAVALDNDTRIHELGRLREAAESDRRALLVKLERQDMNEAIVGAQSGLAAVMERVAQVARTDAPVLILGETGSVKEVVARAIHDRSRRSEGPFLRVNCGAIPGELVDSELFGHEKGSFTGAISQRRGWFERADGGTLFLDEVAELPAAAQVRLLRVLQDGSFQRVGGQEGRRVDVRIIAATHRDMGQMVRNGGFRQDLWYRVSVFPLHLPALRDRRGDIAALAQHFAERAGHRLMGRSLSVASEDLALLLDYPWPGNVRELASVIERAAILGGGRRLELAAALGISPGGAAEPESARAPVEAALRQALGRIEGPFGAAKLLGVNPHTLRSRMRRLGIDWSAFRPQR